jgi:small-conductance mechanosensitive channel
MHQFWGDTRTLIIDGSVLAATIVAALILHRLIFFFAARILKRKGSFLGHAFVQRVKRPSLFVLPLLALVAVLPVIPLPEELRNGLQHMIGLGVIASVGWAIIATIDLVSDAIYNRYGTDTADNLAARRIRTQTQVLQRTVVVITVILTIGVMLMTFPAVRHIGLSLLASAGVAGLVVGMAAKSTLASLIAGVQVALTQPFRIDDAVVVEGEWGWIEEIQTTDVVVRVWDLRRLIVPLTYFIEKPFENWTRTTSNILAVVMIYVDYRTPVDVVRQEYRRILEATDLWDRNAWALQVTDFSSTTMQLRALMSAANSSKSFELQCYVREKLIQFLQDKHPECLPRSRNEDVTPKAASRDGGEATQLQAAPTEKPQIRRASTRGV